MTKLLCRLIEKKGNTRHSYGILSGIVGIVCNLILCITKFIIGSLSGSISITADAMNNMSDMASNSVTIVGSKLASKPVDKEHPFGHGRLEYISALAVSGLILIMGFELGKTSIEKIINPSELEFNIAFVIALGMSIMVKLWMAYFNHKLYKITDNINLKAVRQDSLNDCIATFATIASLVVCRFYKVYWLDGAIGLCVSAFILLSGIGIIKDIIGPLLGQPPKKELVDAITKSIVEPEIIINVHDLIIHDYGPGRTFASAHAEVPANLDIMEVHNVINSIEQKIMNEYNVNISIHMDPVCVDDKNVEELKKLALEIINDYDSSFSIHDFRISKDTDNPDKTCIVFDLTVPYSKNDMNKINDDLLSLFCEKNPNLIPVITIEHSLT